MHQRRAQLEALYAAFNRRDIEAVVEHLEPDVLWANGMEGGHEHGRDAVRAYWTRQFEVIRSTVEPVRVSGRADGRVVVDVHQVVRSFDGELLADQHVRHAFAFAGDRIARFDIEDDGPAG